ncbi:MAG: LysR family transcriptional regulator [Rhodobacteraceae bacterium]|nr:LysR family transcriptional regulator [Paracoccaceae bacterium]
MTKLQRRYLPSNAVLRSFEAAARYQSFTLAAEELHLTQSAISRQVKELELIIGTDLFRRVGRGVILTNSGQSLAKDLAVDLENMRRTVMRAVSAGKMGSALRVATLPAFASRWLIPRLPEFSARYPNVEISLSTRLKPFVMAEERFDLAIHFGRPDWPGTNMKFLCSEELVPVASPEFVKAHGIEKLEDLVRVPLLHIITRPFAWQEFQESRNLPELPSLAGKYFDQFMMIIAAASASMGVGLIPGYLIEEEIQNGILVALSCESMRTANNYYLVTPENQNNKIVTKLCDWMIENVSPNSIIPNQNEHT